MHATRIAPFENSVMLCLALSAGAFALVGLGTGRDVSLEVLGLAGFCLGGWAWSRHQLARQCAADNERDRLHALAFGASQDAIIVIDAQRRIQAVNQAFERLMGYTEHEMLGQSPRVFSSGLHDRAFYRAMCKTVDCKGSWQGEIWNRRKNGEIVPEWLCMHVVCDEAGAVQNYVGVLRDLSELKRSQERIDHLLHHDQLTCLPNRAGLERQTRRAIEAAGATRHLAILLVDLDRFKNVNDTLGHRAGDQLLKHLGERLSAHLFQTASISRHGGDEFILVLEDADEALAARIAEQVLRTVAQPLAIGGNPIQVSASIGIALYPGDGNDFDKLLQCADAAMFRAKKRGGARFHFYDEQMHVDANEALVMENHLRRAIANEELALFFQPQVDTQSGAMVGVEALVRWHHPEWGMVAPARFIPQAEASGLIQPLGHWVLRAALRQQASWLRAGFDIIPMAVNLSALEFQEPELCQRIGAALREFGVPASALELELTERVAMDDPEFAVGQIAALHAMGISLSIDDFGTGYSSLSYLKRYKVDKLKIDGSFIKELASDANDRAIVLSTIRLAHSLGLRTVAEGVEHASQMDFLREHGCDEAQGYLHGRPMPAALFAALF